MRGPVNIEIEDTAPQALSLLHARSLVMRRVVRQLSMGFEHKNKRCVGYFISVFHYCCGNLACDPVTLSHEKPGPADCGLKDPRTTAPGKLPLGPEKGAERKRTLVI